MNIGANIQNNPKAQRELLRQRTTASFPYLLEVYNEDYGVLRYANTDDVIVFNGEEYQPAYFEYVEPEMRLTGISDSQLNISCVDQEWIRRIRTTSKRTKVKVVALIVYDENTGEREISEIETITFTVVNTAWNDISMSFTLKFDESMDILMPCDVLGALNCAGCV